MDNDITMVTSFYDIGRGKWNNEFIRSSQYYIQSFFKYLNYPYKMICFIDDRYIDEIISEYIKSKYRNKIFIPINKEWLIENIRAWRNYERESTIINGDDYQNYIKKERMRLIPPQYFNVDKNINGYLFPENVYPEYNLINHSKVDFMMYAKKCGFIKTTMICWSDFGFFYSQCKTNETYPINILDVNKIPDNKMMILSERPIIECDYNMFSTLIYAPPVLRGSFMTIPIKLLDKIQDLYHVCIDELYDNNICDDDQHVFIRCICKSNKKNEDIFFLYIDDKNDDNALRLFQKDT